ncbi:MAG: gluconate 2-dehydrogenase subunit 3 family protein [Pseudomonadota bacterium]|nr:gluconate 2-dehydrogenase subunit 3 family protein [Pseudomonadota bacterium]MDP2352630.1 gluconate 2-dehydrogenase subunit 3 family protein [Pseudomonadota bacterium]
MKRRAFLFQSGSLAVASLPLTGLTGCGRKQAGTADLPDTVWRTLAAVHAHLFPSETAAPGAAELDTLGYLKAALDVPGFDPAERAAIVQGAEAVETQAKTHTGKSFAELAEAEREAVLRAVEATDAGRTWLTGMLNYLVEALLADPVYGGNPNGIGWRWLDHNPGFPRPPAGKRWFLLKSI